MQNHTWVFCDPMDCSPPGSSLSMGFPRQEYWSGLPFPFPLSKGFKIWLHIRISWEVLEENRYVNTQICKCVYTTYVHTSLGPTTNQLNQSHWWWFWQETSATVQDPQRYWCLGQAGVLPECVVIDFPGGSDGKESACDAGDSGSIPGSGRSPGEGNDYQLQFSCLENSTDRGTWWSTVHGVSESWTWVSNEVHIK